MQSGFLLPRSLQGTRNGRFHLHTTRRHGTTLLHLRGRGRVRLLALPLAWPGHLHPHPQACGLRQCGPMPLAAPLFLPHSRHARRGAARPPAPLVPCVCDHACDAEPPAEVATLFGTPVRDWRHHRPVGGGHIAIQFQVCCTNSLMKGF